MIFGHVAGRDAEWAERIHTWCTQHGSIAGPMKVWLAHRSLTTLSVRLERHCFNAEAIAEYLAARTEVLSVRYPGSPTDPTHAIAEQQIKLFGSVVSFVLPDQSQAERFLQSCELVYEATSFGVIHTTAERSTRGVAINPGWIYSLECKL